MSPESYHNQPLLPSFCGSPPPDHYLVAALAHQNPVILVSRDKCGGITVVKRIVNFFSERDKRLR
ncbi:MAG TPA: hypothetical protein VGH07_00230 [Chthoniobacterales bacterium]